MKILHIEMGRHLYGGAKQVDYLLEGLQQRGVENALACPRGAAIGTAMSAKNLPVFYTRRAGDLSLPLRAEFYTIIKEFGPDIVHLHSRRGADTFGALAARKAGVPVVLSRRVDNREARLWVAIKYRWYDRIITISEGIKQVLVDEGVAANRIRCVRSAISASDYQQPATNDVFRETFAISRQGPVIGVIAQLIHRKGHRHLIAALPEIVSEHPDTTVIFFGKGSSESALRQSLSNKNLQDRVIFAGFRDDIARWIGCLDLIVHPADLEGLGISLIQAAAAGVPIVASRTGGIPEIVRESVNGRLTSTGDPRALATAVIELLADTELRHKFGAAGRALVEAEFSVDAMVEGNLAVYRTLLDAP